MSAIQWQFLYAFMSVDHLPYVNLQTYWLLTEIVIILEPKDRRPASSLLFRNVDGRILKLPNLKMFGRKFLPHLKRRQRNICMGFFVNSGLSLIVVSMAILILNFIRKY